MRKKENDEVKFFSSMKFKVMALVILSVVITAVCSILLIGPSAKNKVQKATNDNMLSIATGFGNYIDAVQKDAVLDYAGYQSILGDIAIEDVSSSYVYVVSSDGIMVYHPTAEKVGNPVENACVSGLVEKLAAGQKPADEVVTYDFKGKNKTAAYHILSDNSIFVVTADTEEISASVNAVLITATAGAVVLVLVMAVLAVFVARLFSNPIIDATKILTKVSKFDFKDSPELDKLVKNKDETGQMGRALKLMTSQLKDLVSQIDAASGSIHGNVIELESLTNEINSTCTDNSATTEELAAGMAETSTASDRIIGDISSMMDEAAKIKDLASAGEKRALEVRKKANDLHGTTEQATKNTEGMYQKVKDDSSDALEKAKAVEKINELTKAIMDIADQTNLLSLNASIEAARAGEAGKGFAVVADEIGSLAQESAKTSASINEIIVEVNDAVNNMADCLNSTIDFLEKTVLADYKQFGEVSIQYNDDAEGFNSAMNEIELAVEELSNVMGDVSSAISGITNTINESATGVENIAEKTSDIVERTSKNTDIVEECADAVDNLTDIVKKFTF